MKIEKYYFGYVVVNKKSGVALSRAFKIKDDAIKFIQEYLRGTK